MNIQKKIRVLIVDDSLIFREVLSRGVSTDSGIEVIAVAGDPFEARDKILQYEPDVMTCDIEMPKMNGIEFIRRLLPQYALPVIVVSTINEAVLDAMSAGAVDFVTKPDVQSPRSVERFIYELIEKIKAAAKAKVIGPLEDRTKMLEETKRVDMSKIIAIGASTGGTEAIYTLLKAFPVRMPGIVIVQHIPPVFSRMFAERLNHQTGLLVREAQSGDYIEASTVLIAPGDQHMRVKKIGERYKIECFEGEKVNGHCPSVDVLFDSVAKHAGQNAIGVILTGMGYDGAKGLLAIKRKGGRTIGQDPLSSVVYGMPKAAFDVGAVEKQATLMDIPRLIYNLIR